MDILILLNKSTGKVIIFLIYLISRILAIPWFYQFLYYLFTFPDSSFSGLFINIGLIPLLFFILIIVAIIKLIMKIRHKN